jgi:hypothetical protein
VTSVRSATVISVFTVYGTRQALGIEALRTSTRLATITRLVGTTTTRRFGTVTRLQLSVSTRTVTVRGRWMDGEEEEEGKGR